MEKDVKKQANKAKNRIKRVMKDAGVPTKTMSMMEPIVENTAWMEAKLEESRELIGEEKIAIEYDNGGGQRGIRENPKFKAYESLWRSYTLGIQRIVDQIQKVSPAAEEQKEAASNVLQMLIGKKEA